MQNNNHTIVRVADFSVVPGARYRKDGDASAQEFFEDVLAPLVDKDLNRAFTIDFDGTFGYASSFISELARRVILSYGKKFAKKNLSYISNDDLQLVDRFKKELGKKYE